MKTRLTIIIPVYNGEQHLQETLENIFQQTYTDYRLLIINDASTDNTENIVLSFKDPRIVYQRLGKNIGRGAVRQLGVEMADTELIAFQDADDLWESTKLEKQIKFLDDNPDVDICGTSYKMFGMRTENFLLPETDEGIKVGLIFGCNMNQASVVMRKNIFEKYNLAYRSDFPLAQDYKFWADALPYAKFYNLPEFLAFYRRHPTQGSTLTYEEQNVYGNKVKLEILRKIYPDFTKEEGDFHVNNFVKYEFPKINDHKKRVEWANKLISVNKQSNSGIVAQNVLEKTMNHYLKETLLISLDKKYFSNFTLLKRIQYLLSFHWRYLPWRGLFRTLINKRTL